MLGPGATSIVWTFQSKPVKLESAWVLLEAWVVRWGITPEPELAAAHTRDKSEKRAALSKLFQLLPNSRPALCFLTLTGGSSFQEEM